MSASASKISLALLCAGGVCGVLCTLLLAQQDARFLIGQSQEEADRKSTGCVACHGKTDSPTMHSTGTVRLGCTDCHGGKADVQPPTGAQTDSAQYEQAK